MLINIKYTHKTMDNLEYKNALNLEYHKLRYRMSMNGSIAILGMGLAGGILLYDTIKAYNLVNKLIKEPAVKEIYLSGIRPEIEREKELKKMLWEEYEPKVEVSRKTQKVCVGLAGASAAYLLLGLGIPIVLYKKKKKSLEEEFSYKE